MNAFWLCFVPLFVAVDPVGILPLFLNVTSQTPTARTRLIIIESVITASLVSLAFLAGGTEIMRLLGITVADFMIAGGLMLFALSVTDLLAYNKHAAQVEPEGLGAVPLGVPLIAGPAVLTTTILLSNQYGLLVTGLALLANMLIAGALLSVARGVVSVLGRPGTTIMSKIASLLLAAISVMMVRKGVFSIMG